MMLPEVSWFQLLFGALALLSSVMVVSSRSPVVSALSLMSTLFCTAFLYFGLGAYFAGVVQILIYAGAIAVLFVFIIMLLDLKPGAIRIPGSQSKIVIACLASFLFLAVALASLSILWAVEPGYSKESQQLLMESLSAKAVSLEFMSTHMLPFQITGFIVLAGILGVVMLAKSVRQTFEDKS